jgi:uncharacterized cupredoxin-like copper-binding protein
MSRSVLAAGPPEKETTMKTGLWVLIGTLLALGLLAAGCSPRSETSATGNANEAMPAPGDAGMIEVGLKEFTITLTPDKAPAGNIMFHIKNEGKALHAITVKGQGIDKSSANLKGGETGVLQIDNMKAGAYEVTCPVGNHTDRGMVTKFTVTVPGIPAK